VSAASVTVVIVSRGLDALLREALQRLRSALSYAGAAPDSQILVVDNASPVPYRIEDFPHPDTELIRLDRHHGFAAANNIASREIPNEYYLLLNNDVLLVEDALAHLFSILQTDPRVGICGTRLLFPDGSVQHAGVVFGGGDTGPYHQHRRRHSGLVPRLDQDFQAVTGACMLVRRIVWDDLNGLCEDFGFGLEDIDFCLRARQLGWRVRCSNASESIHFESMTEGRTSLDIPARRLFMARWKGRYSIDG
jgi:GT2 family glycosyltransferase